MKNCKKLILFVTLAVLVSIAASCSTTKKLPVKTLTIQKADGSTVLVEAEIADTEETRARGFMERETIPDGTGMLFVFKVDQVLSFWMKNTPHPLSIAYIDRNGRIRDIYDMKPFSLASIVSTVSCRYALEVPQGWFDRVGITTGDILDLSAL